jgi:hypothetical protein
MLSPVHACSSAAPSRLRMLTAGALPLALLTVILLQPLAAHGQSRTALSSQTAMYGRLVRLEHGASRWEAFSVANNKHALSSWKVQNATPHRRRRVPMIDANQQSPKQ